MGKDKFVKEITSMNEDFAKWYTDIVRKAKLVDYSSVRGCMILRPYGYAIWENIQKELDYRLKSTGHENVYMPMFIPSGLLQKEKDHVRGFAPEVAWVTHGGEEELTERLCVRPTSEVLFCEHYANTIKSFKDLPKLYNQWCSVVRWEKTTRPFLRTLEFLWQEGHTAHATAEEAEVETVSILNLYADFCKDFLAIPVVKGKKTEKEKFAGAKETYTIESIMHDGKCLQTATTHNFGDGFAKAFKIQYQSNKNSLEYVYQTSWGITTRLIGAIIMVHGDDNGLILPPMIAPIQLVIIPIVTDKDDKDVLETAKSIKDKLCDKIRVKLDDSDRKPGWKFSEYEMQGVPLRLEIGLRDLANNQVVLVRRDNREKNTVSINELEIHVPELLSLLQTDLYNSAVQNKENRTFCAKNFEEFEDAINKTPGFIKAMWCGSEQCEDELKEKTSATSRCIPFDQENISDTCVCCGAPAVTMVIWGKAY